MDIQNIVQALRQQRSQLDAAISALEGTAPRRGRPPKTSLLRRGPHTMSDAARARISAAQRARWAKQKSEATSKKASSQKRMGHAGKKTSGRKGMSAAARKRLS